MAQSTCPHCQSQAFEVREMSPRGARFKQFFVQCGSCGAPVASLPFYDQTDFLQRIERKVDDLEHAIKRLR